MQQEIEAAVWSAAMQRAALLDESGGDAGGEGPHSPIDAVSHGPETSLQTPNEGNIRESDKEARWAEQLANEAADKAATASTSDLPGMMRYECHSCRLSPDGSMLAYTERWFRQGDSGDGNDEEYARCRSALYDGLNESSSCSSSSKSIPGAIDPPPSRYGRYTLRVVNVAYPGSRNPIATPVPRVQGPLLWSPDGSAVHFLSSGGSQLWTLPVTRGNAKAGEEGLSNRREAPCDKSDDAVREQHHPAEPRLVFKDPDWLSMVFHRLPPNGVLAALCLESDMKVVQMLLLMPSRCLVGGGEDQEAAPIAATNVKGLPSQGTMKEWKDKLFNSSL